MIQAYILVIFFMLPNGNIHVVHEGKPSALRMNKDVCERALEQRMQEAKKQVPWAVGGCMPVIGEPEGLSTPEPKPNRNNI